LPLGISIRPYSTVVGTREHIIGRNRMPEIIQLLSKSYTVRFIGINVRTETVDHKRSQLIHQKSKTRFQDQNREITTVQQPSLHDYTRKHESTHLPSHGTKRNTKQPRTERPKSCNTYLNHIWSDSSGMISETETLDHRLPQFIHSFIQDRFQTRFPGSAREPTHLPHPRNLPPSAEPPPKLVTPNYS
jgi:hypothetical protein